MGCDKASYGPHNIGDTKRGCKVYIFLTFLSDPGVPGVCSMGPDQGWPRAYICRCASMRMKRIK